SAPITPRPQTPARTRLVGQILKLRSRVPGKLVSFRRVHGERGVLVPGVGRGYRGRGGGDVGLGPGVVDRARSPGPAANARPAAAPSSQGSQLTSRSGAATASTARRRGAAGSSASSRNDRRAAVSIATYSSSSSSPLA